MTYYCMLEMGMSSSECIIFKKFTLLLLLLLPNGYYFIQSKIEGYSQSVRQSKEVMFAISVVQAMESNNFVRFFKLIR